jgi:archaetidylserine synthase
MTTKTKNTDANAKNTSLLKLLKPADLLSILNALSGFAAILFVLDGTSVTERALENALVLILLAVVADCLDGTVARKMGSSPIGKYLDSLADMVSFGVAPAIVAYVLFKSHFRVPTTYTGVVLAVCSAYVVCGMLRLARFDAKPFFQKESFTKGTTTLNTGSLFGREEKVSDGFFEGFPITGSATFLASFMLLTIELQPQVPIPLSVPILIGLIGLLCLLMTSRIRYLNIRDKRITIPAGMVFLTLFVLYITSSAFIYPTLAVAVLTAFYICSPFLYKKRENFM